MATLLHIAATIVVQQSYYWKKKGDESFRDVKQGCVMLPWGMKSIYG